MVPSRGGSPPHRKFARGEGIVKGTTEEMVAKRAEFAVRLEDPDFHGATQAEQAEFMGVAPRTIFNWLQELRDSGAMKTIEARMREKVKGHIPAVYAALLKKAKKGDMGAIQLCLQYF